jgi:hypothetical protein
MLRSTSVTINKLMPVLAVVFVPCLIAAGQEPRSTRDALIARAKSLELNTPYVPPPGDPLAHHAS